MKAVRESQFELLRLVAIFFVILHHLVVKGADTAGYVTDYDIHTHGVIGIFLNSTIVGGVNLFILISGWFGIRRITRSIIRLILECVIYGLISYVILVIFSEHNLNFAECAKSCSLSYNWFVVSYIMLLVLSPIIEYTLKAEYSVLCKWIVLLTIFNVFFGYLMGRVNTNGYNAVHFMYLYYIGRFLKMSIERRKRLDSISRYGLLWFFIFDICVALTIFAMNYIEGPIKCRRLFAYNNPFVLSASIALFAWFSQLRLKSRIVNFLATSVFGIYILHTTKFIIPWRNVIAHNIYVHNGYCGLVVLAIAIFIICGLIGLIVNPITNSLTNITHDYIWNFWNKNLNWYRRKFNGT